jgi:cytochrome c oxidase assembly protein subunit 15
MTSFLKSDRSRPVAIWLLITAILVFAMVVVGGATRLTGSGLSITEWKPISGVIPPLSSQAWMAEFQNYQRIPQYRLLNHDMTLAQFQSIFWWEWAHRLLGRVVGVVFAVPFLVFLVLRRLPRRLIWRCLLLFVLGGLQGLVGWWMVASGLEKLVFVAPERLAAHLGLALALYCALIWTAWEAWEGQGRPTRPLVWKPVSALFLALVFIQCLLGALVAGNKAGLVYNDWPLMDGAVFPGEYVQGDLWLTLLHGQAAVQFNHRLVAYLVLAFGVGVAVIAGRARHLPERLRVLAVTIGVLVALQAGLGVATLMTHVPLDLAMAHQIGAALLLATAVTFAWRARRV